MLARATKYTSAIQDIVYGTGHISNTQLLTQLRNMYPEVSATTVHRITSRLKERGLLGTAPPTKDGAMRFDARIDDHDHFICQGCGGIKDIDIIQDVRTHITKALNGCELSGRLVIFGNCTKCSKKGEV